jgi:hypothetical protein
VVDMLKVGHSMGQVLSERCTVCHNDCSSSHHAARQSASPLCATCMHTMLQHLVISNWRAQCKKTKGSNWLLLQAYDYPCLLVRAVVLY